MPAKFYGKVNEPSASIVVVGCLTILALIIVFGAISVAVIMGVWNFVFVPVFHLGSIDWGQAFLIYMLIWLIRSSVVHVSRSS